MRFVFKPMTEEDARAVLSWRYEGEYSFYNSDPADPQEDVREMLDGSFFSATDEQGNLAGFFCVGLTAQVPGGWQKGIYRDSALDIGLGMRPDLTGNGLGLSFVTAGLDFLRRERSPHMFRLVVATFNQRAITVYERAGFHPVDVFPSRMLNGDTEFLLMMREA
jgi:RimJ/RimL family protein N-acetyltransferase